MEEQESGRKKVVYSPEKGGGTGKESKGSGHLARNDSISIKTVKRKSSIHPEMTALALKQ
ncbi:hypothetical protein BTS2_1129 [Bacillus sp. TS-2]|nr:hypothetical protein BTS2_1129 [Bacillus sp. TS-2]